MKLSRTLLLAPLLSGACASLDQAPLVYVSTVKIGVNASAGSPESPGAKVLIGYDQTDAAYVPVQVGRRCLRTATIECDKDKYPLNEVRGSSTLDPADLFVRARTASEAVATARVSYDDAVLALGRAISDEYDKTVKARQFAEAQAMVGSWDDYTAQLQSGGAAAPVALQSEAVEKARTVLKSLAGAQAAADVATATRRQKEAAVTTLGATLTNRQSALAALLVEQVKVADTKNDALSVYGSFDGDASAGVGTGGAPSAGLKLGKTFSTGVAAQQLTEGIRRAAEKSASPQSLCLANATSAANILPSADRAAALTEALKACQSIDR